MDHLNTQQAQMLGEIHGMVSMLREQNQTNQTKLDNISADVTSLKVEAGKQGAVYGGVMAIGMALIIEGAKGWLKQKAGGAGPG